jgi:hypothetical protein
MEWQTDALASASTTGVVEGSDVETTALTATTRLGNYTCNGCLMSVMAFA